MRLKLVINPAAGRGRAGREVERAVKILLDRGAEVECIESRSRDDLVEIGASVADSNGRRVVICGGDGSLNLFIRKLDLGRAVVGIIPLGSGDDFAHVAGIPMALERACEVVLDGEVREVDVALANDVRYVGVAGFGFDAEVTRYANERVRHLRGSLIYVWAALRLLPSFQPMRVLASIDGVAREEELMFAVVSNSGRYGGGIRIVPGSEIDDRLLDSCLVRRCTKLDLIRTLPLAYSGAHVKRPYVALERGSEFAFDTEEVRSVFGDGEPLTTTPVVFRLAEEKLKVLVPRGDEVTNG
jgi:diacylglycerol kinase (ATP)